MIYLPLSLALVANHGVVDPIPFYIGTYTSAKGSQGIYRATLDPATGALSEPVLVAKTKNPSYLALDPSGKHLFAVDESEPGSVSAFSVLADGKLRRLNTQPIGGGAPCHLSVDPKGKYLFTASYVGGVIECLPIQTSGALGKATCVITNVGHGPNRDRQEASHMHWIHADPTGRFIYANDLGTDTVHRYSFRASDGKLQEDLGLNGTSPAGAGPRHAVWGPTGKFLYVNNEMGNSVSVFAIDFANGGLTSVQTAPTLPNPTPTDTGAEIECHPSGKWLYVSNRGDDSVTVFQIAPTGMLDSIQVQSVGVRTPRGFAIDPTGRWLVVGGQNSNDIAVLGIDPETGRLSPRGPRTALGSPVCILFPR